MDPPATSADSLIPGVDIDQLQKLILAGQMNNPNDQNSVPDLSTLLVATIQDARDRISQVEYVFCSQLYPTFQKNFKSLHKLYLEARKSVEDECQEKHHKMASQINELNLEKEKALADKAELMRKVSALEEKLVCKVAEVEKGKELQCKLQQVIESKSSDIDGKQVLLGQYEERLSSLFANIKELEEEKCQLKEELGKNNDDVNKGKEVQKEVLRYVSSQGKKIVRTEELLQYTENERKTLELKLETVEASLGDLRSRFVMKTSELEECRKLQEQLVQENNLNKKEKALLLSKIEQLQENTKDRNAAIPEKSEHYRHLVQQIESKDAVLLTEKQKRKDLLNAYKSLKSQYNFLCVRSGLTEEKKLHKSKVEVEIEPCSHDANKNSTSLCNMVAAETTKAREISSSGASKEEKVSRSNQSADAVGRITEVKKEMVSQSTSDDEERGVRTNQASVEGVPSTSTSPAASKWKTSRNSSSSAGWKRLPSDWRATRSRQDPNGPDPHDSFLDTPLENIRGNLAKALRGDANNIPAPVSRDMECCDSDDETQLEVDPEPEIQKQPPQPLKRSPKEFKYIEPVRKKAQREALQGIECKQCKKFYDAVLPGGEGKDALDGKNGFRCEHLDGVSRHRYRYAPPMTPEGFWNIGFDSEI